MKMSFHSHADKTHFRIKSFAQSLVLKKRHKTIRKWPSKFFLNTFPGCQGNRMALNNSNCNLMSIF